MGMKPIRRPTQTPVVSHQPAYVIEQFKVVLQNTGVRACSTGNWLLDDVFCLLISCPGSRDMFLIQLHGLATQSKLAKVAGSRNG
jgi:hypothetical protein